MTGKPWGAGDGAGTQGPASCLRHESSQKQRGDGGDRHIERERTRGFQAHHSFAVLHRLDYNVWGAWLHPSHLEGQIVREQPPVLLTRNGVSYEMALMAVFRAMGDEMPQEFAVVYL